MGDFVGPQQKSPFDELSKEQRDRFDKALTIADGIKLYNSAGGVGVGAQWAPYAEQMAKRGGLSESEALTLARYRMWKDGAPVIPTERKPALSPQEIAARRDQFLAGDPATRSRLMDEDRAAIYNSQQSYFDSLVRKPEPEVPPQPTPAEPDTPPETARRKEVM